MYAIIFYGDQNMQVKGVYNTHKEGLDAIRTLVAGVVGYQSWEELKDNKSFFKYADHNLKMDAGVVIDVEEDEWCVQLLKI